MSAVFSCERIVAGYIPGISIVHNVSLEVAPAEIVTIIGPNGAGKSTLLKSLVGLVRVDAGTIRLLGEDVTRLRADELVAAGLAYVPQVGNIFTSLSIHENLTIGGYTLSGSELKRRLDGAYEQFPMLAQRRSALGKVLSGGQRQMLAIARGLMTAPKVIMLDEPTAGLSPKIIGEVFNDLKRLTQRGVAVLMVEQNARAALRISDRGYVLAQGRNRLDGSAGDLLSDPEIGSAFLGGRRRDA